MVPAAVRFGRVAKKQQGNKQRQMASFNDYPWVIGSNVAFYCRKRIEKRSVFSVFSTFLFFLLWKYVFTSLYLCIQGVFYTVCAFFQYVLERLKDRKITTAIHSKETPLFLCHDTARFIDSRLQI